MNLNKKYLALLITAVLGISGCVEDAPNTTDPDGNSGEVTNPTPTPDPDPSLIRIQHLTQIQTLLFLKMPFFMARVLTAILFFKPQNYRVLLLM